MDRRAWIAAVVVLLVVAAGYAFWPRSGAPGPSSSAPSDLKIVLASVSGTVEIAEADSSATTPGTAGQTLHSGETLTTGADGGASIEFFSSVRVAVAANSRLKIDMAAANGAKQTIGLRVDTGRIWARILKLLDKDSTFDVTTNNVIASVRGTAFDLIGQNGNLTIDQFDGRIGLSGAATGTLESGFSTSFDAVNPPTEFDQTVYPTPDATRNDHWIRAQLKSDADFARRVSGVRRSLGDTEAFDAIGNEAGPFTLDEPGVEHSGYMTVQIVPPDTGTALVSGQMIRLQALAVFQDQNGNATTKDVTDQATWQVSDPSILTVEQGKATATGSGPVTVVARWNDGTHEHSGSLRLTVGETAQLDTSSITRLP